VKPNASQAAEEIDRVLAAILVRYLKQLREDRFSGPLDLRIALKCGTVLSADAMVTRTTQREEATEIASVCRKREWTRPTIPALTDWRDP